MNSPQLPIYLGEYSVIYILAPAGTASGGQEALHQLAYYLRQEGFSAKMAYYGDSESLVHARYVQYEIPYCRIDAVSDCSENVLICPEAVTHFLNDFLSIKKVIWWLSIGFYKSTLRDVSIVRIITDFLQGKWDRLKEKLPRRSKIFRFTNPEIVNCTASHYAFDFVAKRGGNPTLLIEPLGIEFIRNVINSEPAKLTSEGRKSQILYNPAKKSRTMKRLMEKHPEHTYIPLTGFTPQELTALMKLSKLYVDFGKFPGPERLPKEAAVCGCAIITGTRGAAAFYGDVKIPESYKMKTKNSDLINLKINDLLQNYDTLISEFEPYRTMIYDLESNFKNQIHSIFSKEMKELS